MIYYAEIDYGQGGATRIMASSLEEAVADSNDWVLEGDWGRGGYVVTLRVSPDNKEEGTVIDVDIPINDDYEDVDEQ